MKRGRAPGRQYRGEYLNHVAFPIGGMGAGMICLEGTGHLSHFSVRNKPGVFQEPWLFSAVCIKERKNICRVLEGPVPKCKIFGRPNAGSGLGRTTTYGLPRFADAVFQARFPFGRVGLKDPAIPLKVEITGWSPFIPGDADDSSLPAAGLEYTFRNQSRKAVKAVFSFHSKNFLAAGTGGDSVQETRNGFILNQAGTDEKPWQEAAFYAAVAGSRAAVNYHWFRSGWFDAETMVWKEIEAGVPFSRPPVQEGSPSPGASIYAPLDIPPGKSETVILLLCWYVPFTDIRIGKDPGEADAADCECEKERDRKLPTYQPWYAGKFSGVAELSEYWRNNYERLKEKTLDFTDCFYDTNLPPEVVEAVSANLAILKSPTVLRQTDGRLWSWEGCCDESGCCHGSCTHVWNYAQALCHLFPALERSLRQTEFNENQDETGHQMFRAGLPIRPIAHDFQAASDGQLGGIMKVYRDWRISGDTEWLRSLWPKVKKSLDYCIETWDPEHKGILQEPHHNTYDIEFWGPDGMCGSFYLGALKAGVLMASALNDSVPLYQELYEKGKKYLEEKLFNGQYFFQEIRWTGLRAGDPTKSPSVDGEYSAEAMELMKKEGPKYQYGKGCLSDGVLGAWLAEVCGVGEILNPAKVRKHLQSVYRYNFRENLKDHANPQRPGYALGDEGGLLLCTWPKGEKLSLPFPYSYEVWTGIEYQVASHLMMFGMVTEALRIIRTARARYDGRFRNPFDEYECGHWYGRALSSYGLLQGLTGIRYDAVEKVLYIKPQIKGDFCCFLSTATGYGTAGIKGGKPFLKVRHGTIEAKEIVCSGNFRKCKS